MVAKLSIVSLSKNTKLANPHAYHNIVGKMVYLIAIQSNICWIMYKDYKGRLVASFSDLREMPKKHLLIAVIKFCHIKS